MQPCGLTNPARQSLASSRKRVLRGGGRPPLRSVDSESQCRAIEPRNLLLAGATVVDTSGGRAERRNGLAYFGPTGVQEQGAGTRGSLGNLRDPAVSVVTAGLESRLTNSRLIHSSVPSWWGRTGDERWYRQAKETKCGEMSGRESERSIVTLRRGNLTEGPRGVKGTPFQLTVGGKHGGCIGTRGRVHETTTDSGSRRLKRGAVCVNQ